ncbi:DUF1697 domain-containing protein [Sphingomonas astaxanthinifaciens]|uniref:DUF1697 domain-containing protein n=1 Tax=Sphingomonas astaxanthinifaciens DSM 22298 TaxID=1123267 RepID=A0ABQ5Z720_9SPHN|nr:DUF1697 domain-containing protein [Sphingomonas astaxanthinifaciens]GLR47322.1 hypothetical protein GCM10007925_10330 [Sphingomonas astaxanthinifaciens DSM 22298]
MTAFVALLRAVNVSGTGLLPVAELRAMGERCGFGHGRTLLASGNLLFTTEEGEAQVIEALESELEKFFGRRVPVFVRTAAEMRAIARSNPFPDEKGSRNMVFFLAGKPPADFLDRVRGQQDERIALGTREVSVAYGEGIGKSKLKLPDPEGRPARNRNTVERIADLLEEKA